ncbi:MAG TPA: ligase-associated DNA damage response exonuclease [Usitatibacter sp.]|nr:ligase-associated DNA damage response exonuclease [Usitatibacter sp.]
MLIECTPRGLYCAAGDFHIDPWQPVERAVITHAHADHARPGSARYLCAAPGLAVLRARLGAEAAIEAQPYGRPIDIDGVRVSLHPAGHVLGSAQVRVEARGEVWVVSGDYKLQPDPTCAPFEPLRCDAFVTESTFGLPIYRWSEPARTVEAIGAWWRANADQGRASVLFAYAFGKAQRILASIDPSTGPILVHGAVDAMDRAYRDAGVALPETKVAIELEKGFDVSRALVVAPPSAQGTPWLKRFGDYSDGYASGWMAIRGARRRMAVDQGFVLSDHADWPGLNRAIEATGASRVYVTHGYTAPLVQWLRERGREAMALETRFEAGPGTEA